MEIERKFLISEIPSEMEFLEGYTVMQNYISINPEIRIRKKINADGKTEYFITLKSDGNLVREEKETKIDKFMYKTLLRAALGEDIIKNTFILKLDNNHNIECSIVDFDRNTKFMYAEIEFDSVKDAISFNPPSFFEKETTYNKNYKMKNYFCSTRLDGISPIRKL